MTIDENTKNNSKEKPISDMFNEFDEKLQSRLLEQESKIAEKINSLSKSSVSSSQKSQTEDEIWNAASDDDEEIITKKDLKKYLSDFENKAQKLAETLVETKLAEVTTKAGRDQQAFMEFPLLNPQSSSFSKEFTEAVKKEIDTKLSRGRSKDDPDLIYDCAAIVKATNPKFMKNIDDQVREQDRVYGNTMAGFTVKGTSSKDSNTPNARQIELGRNMGIDEKFLKDHFKKRA